jgi:hypothetical protein
MYSIKYEHMLVLPNLLYIASTFAWIFRYSCISAKQNSMELFKLSFIMNDSNHTNSQKHARRLEAEVGAQHRRHVYTKFGLVGRQLNNETMKLLCRFFKDSSNFPNQKTLHGLLESKDFP